MEKYVSCISALCTKEKVTLKTEQRALDSLNSLNSCIALIFGAFTNKF